MSYPFHGVPLSLSLHDTRRLTLVCHLLLADGVARRVEEWCGSDPPRLSEGWARHLSAMELRRQMGDTIARTLPTDINKRLFYMVYAQPLFLAEPGQPAFRLQLPEIAFLASDVPPPLEVILSQTGFPHSIVAAWFLAMHYPLFDEKRNLHPVWATFYFRQLLEWHMRMAWLLEVMPEMIDRQLGYPLNIMDGRFPFPESLNYQPQHILEFCHQQDGAMDFNGPPETPPVSRYTLDWFRRSMHPDSPYQQARLEATHDRPPEVARRFREFPHLEHRFQLFIEQRGVLMYFGSLRPLFASVGSGQLMQQLLSPFAAAAWLDFHALLPPNILEEANSLGM